MQRKAISLFAMTETAAETRRTVNDLACSYGPRVFRSAYRILGNKAAAQDIQQEVFLRLLKKLPRDVQSWPALLTTMATRIAIDHLRTHHRRTRLLAFIGPRDGPRSPEELSQAGELAAALRAALGSLSQRESEVFCLRYLSELSIRQVARVVHLSENNVGVILHRARRKLAERLSLTPKEKG